MGFDNNDTIYLPRHSRTSIFIEMCKGVKSIPENYCEDYDQLTYIMISNTIRYIGKYAFKGCSSLRMVHLAECMSTIGVECFCQCTNMTTVYITNSIYDKNR